MGESESISLDIETRVNESRRRLLFIPEAFGLRATNALRKLMPRSEEEIKLLMAQVVDYHGLMDVITAAKAFRSGGDEVKLKKAKLILDMAKNQLKLAESRRFTLFKSGALALKAKGENDQMEEERTIIESRKKQNKRAEENEDLKPVDLRREVERIGMQKRLWEECAVWTDVDIIPKDLSSELAEESLKKVPDARLSSGITWHVLRPANLGDLADQIRSMSKEVAKLKAFGTHPQSDEHAVGFIRELHLFGHGAAGSKADQSKGIKKVDPQFVLCGLKHQEFNLTPKLMKARVAENPSRFVAEFSIGLFRDLIVPGGTIHFRGCAIGRGDQGKHFLALVAYWMIGRDKWGFIKANTENVFAAPGFEKMGPPDRDPVTYKWPDDLVNLVDVELP